jgi:hypothetical protein
MLWATPQRVAKVPRVKNKRMIQLLIATSKKQLQSVSCRLGSFGSFVGQRKDMIDLKLLLMDEKFWSAHGEKARVPSR